MKIKIIYTCLFFSLVCYACKTDAGKSASDASVELDKEFESELTSIEKSILSSMDTIEAKTVVEVAQDDEEMLESDSVEKQTREVDFSETVKEKKEETIKAIKNSPNKGKECDQLLLDLEKIIEEYLDDPSAETGAKLGAWSQDKIHNDCRKNEDYETRFNELMTKL